MESEFIFSPKQTHSPRQDSSTENTYYTVIGMQNYLDSNKRPILNNETDKCFAKCITTDDNTKYYIKIGTYGKVFNPIGMYSEGNSNKFLSRSGKNEYNFKQVNLDVFNMYLNFLSTKNLAWLNNAERALM